MLQSRDTGLEPRSRVVRFTPPRRRQNAPGEPRDRPGGGTGDRQGATREKSPPADAAGRVRWSVVGLHVLAFRLSGDEGRVCLFVVVTPTRTASEEMTVGADCQVTNFVYCEIIGAELRQI